jgi:LPS-assembly lipoprotein
MRRRENDASCGRFVRLALVLSATVLLAGCFQPLYGERSPSGGSALREAFSAIEVLDVAAQANSSEARLAVQIKNDLIFNFTGGGSPYPPTHRLKIQLAGGRSIVSIDRGTTLPNVENYALNATYSLIEIATGKGVVGGTATTSVSYDTLGQQRFARISGMHDAERRAAKVISDNITARLASYFVAGS